MPSPTWRTVPTSARSISTSYCSIRSFRIEVISSGRSFTWSLLLCGWLDAVAPEDGQLLCRRDGSVVGCGARLCVGHGVAQHSLSALDHVGAARAHQLDGLEHLVRHLHVMVAGGVEGRVEPVQVFLVGGGVRRR